MFDTYLYTRNDRRKLFVFLYVEDIQIFHEDVSTVEKLQEKLELNLDSVLLGRNQQFLELQNGKMDWKLGKYIVMFFATNLFLQTKQFTF